MAAEVFASTFSLQGALRQRLLDVPPDVLGIYTNLMTNLNVFAIMRFVRARRRWRERAWRCADRR